MPQSTEHALPAGYRHEAFFYGDPDEFMRGALSFVRDSITRDEAILVVVDSPKIDALRRELGSDAPRVRFADMSAVGSNPARIIPVWQAFLSEHARDGARVRGIGEPISGTRDTDELSECHRHEALLNAAFAGLDFWLLCPYDTEALDGSVLAEAARNHPFIQLGAHLEREPELCGHRDADAAVRPTAA